LALTEVVSFTAKNNTPSEKVMQAIGMHHDSADDFEHPRLAADHPLRHHVLYRITREQWLQTLHG
jgi:RimJ/RimL family protein N-acetyltransferase